MSVKKHPSYSSVTGNPLISTMDPRVLRHQITLILLLSAQHIIYVFLIGVLVNYSAL